MGYLRSLVKCAQAEEFHPKYAAEMAALRKNEET